MASAVAIVRLIGPPVLPPMWQPEQRAGHKGLGYVLTALMHILFPKHVFWGAHLFCMCLLLPFQPEVLQHNPDCLASWGTLELIKALHISLHEGHIYIYIYPQHLTTGVHAVQTR